MSPALILAIFEALPDFMKAAPQALSLIERFLNWSKGIDVKAWKDNLEGGINDLQKAKTQQEKLDAAHRLADSIRNLG